MRRCRQCSRYRQRDHAPDPRSDEHASAGIHGRAGGHHIVNENDAAVAKLPGVQREKRRIQGERGANVRMPARRRQTRLGRPAPPPAQNPPDRQAEMSREIVSLIEPASERAPWVQGHGDHGIRGGEQIRTRVPQQVG